MTELIIPKAIKITGLYVYCNRCKSKSKTKLEPKSNCSHPVERQCYRAIITVKGTKSVMTKTLSKNLKEAITETLAFEEELIKNNYQKTKERVLVNNNPITLEGCMKLYINYLSNLNIPEYQKKQRTHGHIQQVTSHFKYFGVALKNSGVNIKSLLIKNINEHHVEIFYKYLVSREYKGRTYNGYLNSMSNLYTYLIKVKGYDLKNYFSPKFITRRRVNYDIDSMDVHEFKKMLEIIKPENGTERLRNGVLKYHYYNWLQDAFELALLTGLRRDGLVNMKFSDIQEKDGRPIRITVEDYKNNRRNNDFVKSDKKVINVPVFEELYLFLLRVGYNEFKGSDRYLVAPNSDRVRTNIRVEMTRSFSHYYKQLGTGKNLTFKHLRKTYITLLNNHTGGSAFLLTGHADSAILSKHYHDSKILQDVLKDFKILN